MKKQEISALRQHRFVEPIHRLLPVAFSALGLGMVVACGNNANHAASFNNHPVAGNTAAAADVQKTFPKFDASKAQNQNLISRVLGVTAIVSVSHDAPATTAALAAISATPSPSATPGQQPSTTPTQAFDVKVSILVGHPSKNALAVQVVSEGLVIPGQETNPQNVRADGKPRKSIIDLKSDESSPESMGADGKQLYTVEAICKNSDCSILHVMLRERIEPSSVTAAAAATADASDAAAAAGQAKQSANRQFVMSFQRKAGGAADAPYVITYAPALIDSTPAPAVDPRTSRTVRRPVTSRAFVHLSFEDARSNFEGVVSPSPKDGPGAIAKGPSPTASPAPAAQAVPGASPAATTGPVTGQPNGQTVSTQAEHEQTAASPAPGNSPAPQASPQESPVPEVASSPAPPPVSQAPSAAPDTTVTPEQK